MRTILIATAALVVSACGGAARDETAQEDAAPAETAAKEADVAGPGEASPQADGDPVSEALARPPAAMSAAVPDVNARRGRILFVAKGCVLCHAANGVGGEAAPAFAAPEASTVDGPPVGSLEVDPLAFSSRMWKGAAAMVSLQRLELGYQIELDAQDLADLAAFAASADEQRLVTADSLPVGFQNWFVDARFWDNEEWGEYLERGEFPDLGDYEGEGGGSAFDRP